MSTGIIEHEVLPDLPSYGFFIFSALFLSIIGNYVMSLWLVSGSNLEIAYDKGDE